MRTPAAWPDVRRGTVFVGEARGILMLSSWDGISPRASPLQPPHRGEPTSSGNEMRTPAVSPDVRRGTAFAGEARGILVLSSWDGFPACLAPTIAAQGKPTSSGNEMRTPAAWPDVRRGAAFAGEARGILVLPSWDGFPRVPRPYSRRTGGTHIVWK